MVINKLKLNVMTQTIDLNSKGWCDLVFANKNQAYGAYVIRKTSSKRHLMSLGIVILLVTTFSGLPVMIKKLFPTEISQVDSTEKGKIILVDYLPEEKKTIELVKPAEPVLSVKPAIKFPPPVIKPDPEVLEVDEIPTQGLLSSTNAVISTKTTEGDPNGTVDPEKVNPNAIMGTVNPPIEFAEQMPQFIGEDKEIGDKELIRYLGKNIKYPIPAIERGIQGTVVLRFVVDKDGSIKDITILRSLDPHCDKEAIRIIKSTSNNWIPGEQNGNKVAVYFTLPIKFQLNS